MDPKYKNSKIYEITSNNTDMFYVGSCIVTLKQRLSLHKSSKKCSSRYILERGDYNINLIEEYSCNNNDELRMREQYWIDKYRREGKNVINKQNAYRSENQLETYQKEYQKCRKPRIEYQREYREKNREKHNEYKREFRFMNKKEYVNACYEFLEMLKHY